MTRSKGAKIAAKRAWSLTVLLSHLTCLVWTFGQFDPNQNYKCETSSGPKKKRAGLWSDKKRWDRSRSN